MALELDHLTIFVNEWDAYERHYGTLLPLVGFDHAGLRAEFTYAPDGQNPVG